jgi:hypothetical protein
MQIDNETIGSNKLGLLKENAADTVSRYQIEIGTEGLRLVGR